MLFAICSLLFAGLGAFPAQQSTIGPAVIAPQAPAAASGAQSQISVADRLYRTGELDSAAEQYKRILQTDPKSAAAYVGLARVYLKQKKPGEASGAASKAMELAPGLDAAHVAMGEVYFRQGKLADAEKEFAPLVNAQTIEARAYLGLARLYRSASFYKQWKRMTDRAYALDPSDPDVRRAWVETLDGQERIKALRAYLAGPTNDDAEDRRNLEQQLVVRQDQADHPGRECRITTKTNSMEMGFEQFLFDLKHTRAFGLRVSLNGIPSRLLLDTGAGGITVDRRIAEKAGLKRIVEIEHKGIGDDRGSPGYVAYADSIKVGKIEFQGCYVSVIEKGSVLGEDGLIGSDVFSDFLVDIDYPAQKFRLSDLPRPPDQTAPDTQSQSSTTPPLHDRYIAPEMKSFSRVFRFGHDLLIPTGVNDLPPKLFIIDTGGFGNMISPAAAAEVTKVSTDRDARIQGLSGSVKKVFRASRLTLHFGGLWQNNQDVVSFDTKSLSDSIGAEMSGILGFALLRMLRIKIDYRDGLVDFKYDPAHH